MQKYFIDANELLSDSFTLAKDIVKSNFRPDFVIGVWRGGTPTGIAIQEYLSLAGIKCDHAAIRAASYYGINQQNKEVKVFGLDYVVQQLTTQDKLLIVDDVFDTGRSIEAIIQALHHACGKQVPLTIKVACPWFKPKRNITKRVPDFFLHETNDWLVFPHELEGLSLDEIRTGKGEHIAALCRDMPPFNEGLS
ncbi:phosphoribosyltransferase [Agaribacterium sp. ZY112]|uniref:phosphoribosyltransferase n=1 Tax=Agaribacterium sp. ZY112 TaxID=3233574 RepID=UPI0035257D60